MTTQEPDRVNEPAIKLVGIGVAVITLVLIVIAWVLVRPPGQTLQPAQPSPLDNHLFGGAEQGQSSRADGLRRLERYDWVDRGAHLVRIPIELAIDAVAQDPALIGLTRSPEAAR